MKVTIRDSDVLATIPPLDAAAYLRSRGWQERRILPQKGSYWTTTREDGEEFEVALPVDRRTGDFLNRMGDLLRTLEEAEDRSQIEILRDLMTSASDVIQIPATYAAAADGTMPFDDGVSFVQNAWSLVMAAAFAAERPKETHHSRRPATVDTYLKSLRMGQTGRGSYTITVVSRVPPAFKASSGQLSLPVTEPFERRVTATLSKALIATRAAAERATATGDLESFRGAVRSGISANFCESLAGLSRFVDPSQGISIDFSWSRTRPAPEGTPNRLVIPNDSIRVIQEAGRLLRETSPRDDFDLYGMVTRLDREPGAEVGRVTIAGVVDGRPRKVSVWLEPSDYDLAGQAHSADMPVFCVGNLVKEGNAYVLRSPYIFDTLPAEDDDLLNEQAPNGPQ